MAAADEFPRGLTLSTSIVESGTAALTFPAAAGVAWVLTSIDAKCINGTTAEQSPLVYDTLQRVVGMFSLPAGAPSIISDEFSWTGEVAYPPDTDLTVTFNIAASVNFIEALIVTAFPI